MQMAEVCRLWRIPYINLADIKHPDEISKQLISVNPKIVLCSIEDVSDPAIQKRLQKLNVGYVAVDEAQVLYKQDQLEYVLWFINDFYALFEEDMNRNGIVEQNNDNIIDEPQDILEEDVEGVMTINNKLFIFPVYYDKKPNFWLFSIKKPNIWL